MTRLRRLTLAVSAIAALLAGCDDKGASEARLDTLVRTQTVFYVDHPRTVAVTGSIEARIQNDLAFRVAGRITERLVGVGDHVEAGQVLARLNPQEQKADLDAAQASVDAAEAVLRQTTATLERQKALLDKGFTTRRQYDAAEEAYRVAQGSLNATRAQLATARENLTDTDLKSEAAGVITERQAEVGQVVQPGQAVFTLAQDGPRDAVFDVFESLLAEAPRDQRVTLSLVSDPSVTAGATLREISPTIDAKQGTVRLKFAIKDPPPALTLAASVVGIAVLTPERLVLLPWSALFSDAGKPSVWVVDPATHVVHLKPVTVAFHERGQVAIRSGLDEGDVVVSAGGQLLRPNQVVAIAEGEPQ